MKTKYASIALSLAIPFALPSPALALCKTGWCQGFYKGGCTSDNRCFYFKLKDRGYPLRFVITMDNRTSFREEIRQIDCPNYKITERALMYNEDGGPPEIKTLWVQADRNSAWGRLITRACEM